VVERHHSAQRDLSAYRDPRPNSKIGRVRIALMTLLDEHRRDHALPTSVRFLFYELVTKRIISKSGKRPDKIVSEALTDLRERHAIRWEWIVDETRSVEDHTGSDSVAEDWLLYLHVACIDPWNGQVPFIITESRSLAGVLRGVSEQYRVRIAATNGQVGGFLHTEVAPKLKRNDKVLYLGDADLCGNHIEANMQAVLEGIVGKLRWERLALTDTQIEEHNLPKVWKKDKRYTKGGGEHEAVETEALSQRLIIDIVRTRLNQLLPQPLDEVLVREDEERDRLRALVEGEA
jgi:hypothetical protein